MQKLIYFALAAVMSASLTACGGKDSKSSADKAAEAAQQVTAATAPEQTEAPDPELLAKLEQLEPFCGGFSYDEYDTTMYGKVEIGGVVTVMVNENNQFSVWLPSGLVRVPPESYDDIINTGSCEFKKDSEKYSLTWSEDMQTLYFKHYRGDGEVVPAEGSAERFR